MRSSSFFKMLAVILTLQALSACSKRSQDSQIDTTSSSKLPLGIGESSLDAAKVIAIDRLEFTDIQGKSHAPFDSADTKAIALVFVAIDCPIANFYQPTLSRLSGDYSSDGVHFFLVHSDPDLKREAAIKHAQEFKTTSPVILDADQAIAKLVGAKVTPEAHLIDRSGRVQYRGRINDLYVDFGKRRRAPRVQDLRRAIESLLDGKEIEVTETTAVGCYIPYRKTSRPADKALSK